VRPYIFGGVGATQYSPGDVMGVGIDGNTKFSSTWGGGVKFFASEHFGINLMARWTPTYIKSDPGGIWCNPYWPGGCWQLSEPDYSNQLQFAGGVTFRF
jgi:opacity protein-like surface antigen